MGAVKRSSPRSIQHQITRIFVSISFAAVIIIALLILMLIGTNSQYTSVLKNANTAADFNKEFKNSIDRDMYNHVIQPWSADSMSDLPTAELDNAVNVLKRLEKTTVLTDNRWRITSMLNMCENLRGYMAEISQTERYDERMELLDRNVRGETGLTKLIETYMHDYIDDEVREMARLQRSIRSQTTIAVIFSCALLMMLIAFLSGYSVKISKQITLPISALSKKAERFGSGDLAAEPVETDIAEFQTLDRGFDEMAQRIDMLMANQIRDQKALHRAELELLQAQINPHFLYNTLDSIAILAENDRGSDAVRMVNSLSSFFRISLSGGKDIITLAAEENHVRSYLEIQQIRYSDILRYEINIDDDIKKCSVPKLILQPLVENALYHGIKNRRGIGTISVTGKREGSDILIWVRDNGIGMDPDQTMALISGIYEDRHTGLGLVNVHKRIKLYCGEGYGLSFESEKGRGTTVTVKLPGNMPAERQDEMI